MSFLDDWHDKLTGEKTGSQRRAEAHDRDRRTESSENRQNKLKSRGYDQTKDAGHGYDASAINQRDSWSSWDHKKMKSMVDDIDTGAITTRGGDWQDVGRDVAGSFDQFHTEVTGAVKGGWTGDAATSAATAPDGMAKWGKAMGAASQGTGTRIQQAATAADQAKINMPEPQNFSWRRTLVDGAGGLLTGGFGGGVLSGGKDAYAQHKEAQQAKQQAVNVMNRMYTQGYVDVDNTTPAFAAPEDDNGTVPPEHRKTQPTREWPPQPPPGHRGGSGTGTGGGDTSGGNDSRPDQPGQTGVTDPSQTDTGGSGNNNLDNPPGTTDPSNTDPTGRSGLPGTGLDPHGTGAPGAGGGGGMGMPMMGGGGGGGFGAGDSEYGGRGYGRGQGPGAGTGSGASESGSGGRSGIGGSAAQEAMGGRGSGRGGTGGGGRGGRKEEDAEHQSPDYLVESDDVFGSGEMVAPPVIGES